MQRKEAGEEAQYARTKVRPAFTSFLGYCIRRCELYLWFYSFRSRNNSRHSVHGARRKQTRSRQIPPWVSHVKIVIMRQALGGRRISRIDMPPPAESIETIHFTFSAPRRWHQEVSSTCSVKLKSSDSKGYSRMRSLPSVFRMYMYYNGPTSPQYPSRKLEYRTNSPLGAIKT